jgi:polysaccharide biosynthesis/export protein
MTYRASFSVLSAIVFSMAAWPAAAQSAPPAGSGPAGKATATTTPAAPAARTPAAPAKTPAASDKSKPADKTAATPAASADKAPVVAPVVTPPGYIIGTDDVLTVVFWREKDVSGDVVVRPDGKISLPLINDVVAAGRTPDELRAELATIAARYLEDPNPTVVVKQINSRKVYVTGNVMKPGAYPIMAPTSVLQLLAQAGGLREFADEKNIIVVRTENGKQSSYRINYHDVVTRKNLRQNITLRAGDTVVVP